LEGRNLTAATFWNAWHLSAKSFFVFKEAQLKKAGVVNKKEKNKA